MIEVHTPPPIYRLSDQLGIPERPEIFFTKAEEPAASAETWNSVAERSIVFGGVNLQAMSIMPGSDLPKIIGFGQDADSNYKIVVGQLIDDEPANYLLASEAGGRTPINCVPFKQGQGLAITYSPLAILRTSNFFDLDEQRANAVLFARLQVAAKQTDGEDVVYGFDGLDPNGRNQNLNAIDTSHGVDTPDFIRSLPIESDIPDGYRPGGHTYFMNRYGDKLIVTINTHITPNNSGFENVSSYTQILIYSIAGPYNTNPRLLKRGVIMDRRPDNQSVTVRGVEYAEDDKGAFYAVALTYDFKTGITELVSSGVDENTEQRLAVSQINGEKASLVAIAGHASPVYAVIDDKSISLFKLEGQKLEFIKRLDRNNAVTEGQKSFMQYDSNTIIGLNPDGALQVISLDQRQPPIYLPVVEAEARSSGNQTNGPSAVNYVKPGYKSGRDKAEVSRIDAMHKEARKPKYFRSF